MNGRHAPYALVFLAVIGLLMGTISAAGATEEPSDIPGIPLVRRVVEGEVGGADIDDVYSIGIPSGSVLVVTLRGDAGAELGLYVFDGGAASILVDQPVALSAKPGAVQVVSVPLVNGGAYYLNVNGRNLDRGYGYILSYSFARDTSPPVIDRLSLPVRARSSEVCAAFRATDNISGVMDIRIRDLTRGHESVWQPYSGEKSYCVPITGGDGQRFIDVLARNGVGLSTASERFIVNIDDTPPQLVSTKPSQAGVLLDPQGAVKWRFNEPVRLSEGRAGSVYAVDQGGRAVAGDAVRVGDGSVVQWTPSQRVVPGTMLLVSLVGVTDRAGNSLGLIDSLELFRKQRAGLTLSIESVRAKSLLLRYSVSTNLVEKEIFVEIREGGVWSVHSVLVPGSTLGSYRLARGNWSAVRLRWAGDERIESTVSVSQRLE